MTATIHQYFKWPSTTRISVMNPDSDPLYQSVIDLSFVVGMQSDFQDVRFFNLKGEKLPYWIETYTSESQATVWIRGAVDREVIVLFGNPEAESESDGTLVFEFFEHFLDLDQWTETNNNGNTSVSGSHATLAISGTNSAYYTRIVSTAFSRNPVGTIFEMSFRPASVGRIAAGFANRVGLYDTSNNWRIYNGPSWSSYASANVDTPSTSLYKKMKVVYTETAVTVYYDGAEQVTTDSVDTSEQAIWLRRWYTGAGTDYVDFCYVRRYSATEPTLSLNGIVEVNPYYFSSIRNFAPEALVVFDAYTVTPTTEVTFTAEQVLSVTVKVSPPPLDFIVEQVLAVPPPYLKVPVDMTVEQVLAVPPPYLKVPVELIVDQNFYLAPIRQYWDLDSYDWVKATVIKSYVDPVGSLTIEFDGTDLPPMKTCLQLVVPDHLDVDHCIFCGIIPTYTATLEAANDKTSVTGYEYGFYLTHQYFPSGDLVYPSSLGWTPMGMIKYWLGEESVAAGSTSKWWSVTGIRPYNVQNPTTHGHDYEAKDFEFTASTTKSGGIDEVCAWADMVRLIKPRLYDGRYAPAFYFVHREDIDETYGLDLPSPVTFTNPDPYVVKIQAVNAEGEQSNRVVVRGFTDEGAWHIARVESAGVQAGTEIPIEYPPEESDDFDTYEKCLARAQKIYAYLDASANYYVAQVLLRTDLELLQLVTFAGWDNVPETQMRIIEIRYEIEAANVVVYITCSTNTALSDISLLKSGSTEADSADTTEEIAETVVATTVQIPEVGNIATIDGSSGTVELESGSTVSVRYIGTIAPTVGAQVLVIPTRSGLVALTGTEGESYSEDSDVNPPEAFAATRTSETEVYLTWTPGDDNDYVCIRRKAGSYPATPTDGTIVGNFPPATTSYVNTASDDVTYYYRAWGMQNGVYSDEYLQDVVGTIPSSDPIMICDAWMRYVSYAGEEVSYGPFWFYWDGTGAVYISADPETPTTTNIDDLLTVTGPIDSMTEQGSQLRNISSLLQVGSNSITVVIKDLPRGSEIGTTTALYIMQYP